MSTNKVKTTKKAVTVNTINAKQFYFIIDQLIFCTEKRYNNFIPAISKECLSSTFNTVDLKNIIIPGALLKQIELYQKDNFKIDSIEKVVFWDREYKDYTHKLSQDEIKAYDLNDTYYLKISDIKHEYYKPKEINKLQITLSNSAGSIAKLEHCYFDLDSDIIPISNKPILSDLSKEYILSSNDLAKLKTALKYISNNELRQVLCNVAIQQNNIVATDGKIMYFDKLSFEIDNDIILSASDLSQFFKSNKNTMEATLQICQGFCSLNNFEIQQIDGNYPAWKSIIPNNYIDTITFNKIDFPMKVKTGMNKNTNLIKFNSLGLKAEDNTTSSMFNYPMNINSKCDFIFAFDYKKLVTVLKEIDSEIISIQNFGYAKPVIINDCFIVMPLKQFDCKSDYEKELKELENIRYGIKKAVEIPPVIEIAEPVKVEPIANIPLEVKSEVCSEKIMNFNQAKELFNSAMEKYFEYPEGINICQEIEQDLQPTVDFLKAELLFKSAMKSFYDNIPTMFKSFYSAETIAYNCNKILDQRKKNVYKINLYRAFNHIIYSIKALPIHIPTIQEKPLKTVSKTTLNQIEYKQVLSLPMPKVQTLPACHCLKNTVSYPAVAEQIELADYTEIPMESDLGNCRSLDNFYELYFAKLKEKRALRKSKINFAGKFNQVLSFSSVAIMLFVFIHTFLSVQSSNNTFDLLAGNQAKQEQVKSTANLTDLSDTGTIQQDSKEPLKNMPFDSFKWISLVLCFGSIKQRKFINYSNIQYVNQKERNRDISIYTDHLNDDCKKINNVDYLTRNILKYRISMTAKNTVQFIFCSEINIEPSSNYYHENNFKTLEGKEARAKYKELCKDENKPMLCKFEGSFILSNSDKDSEESVYFRNGRGNFFLEI